MSQDSAEMLLIIAQRFDLFTRYFSLTNVIHGDHTIIGILKGDYIVNILLFGNKIYDIFTVIYLIVYTI